ncbi:hypothetical protein [Streptosporangium sp. CA-115845]|uniref:hypothetical protein n=1 Tax=Streptosporangium sp. CA-115845 TaxID=3240071 RepID=UPI003D9114CC
MPIVGGPDLVARDVPPGGRDPDRDRPATPLAETVDGEGAATAEGDGQGAGGKGEDKPAGLLRSPPPGKSSG